MDFSATDIQASFAGHHVRTIRHIFPRVQIDAREETVVMISGSRETLGRISAVVCGKHATRFDHAASLVKHDEHSDPLVIFEDECLSHIQVFFFEMTPETAPERISVEIDGELLSLVLERRGQASDPSAMRSDLVYGPDGAPVLHVFSQHPFEVIEQRLRLARTTEDRTLHEAGEYTIELKPGFADVYGVAISSNMVMGGIEHKHQIVGHFELPSGRKVVADGRTIGNGREDVYTYQAGLLICDAHGIPGGAIGSWNDFNEIEVLCRPDQVSLADKHLKNYRGAFSFLTFGSEEPCDVLIIEPDAKPPAGRPFSYMLAMPAERPDFEARLLASIAAIECLSGEHQCLDRLWLAARAPYDGSRRYGVAFSLPSHTDIKRAYVLEFRRRVIDGIDPEPRLIDCLPFPAY